MNFLAILAAVEQVAPVIIDVADELKLNKVAADLLRKLAVTLIADAKKTSTPIDDALTSVASTLLSHLADLLEQGSVAEAKAIFAAISKLVTIKPVT